MLFVAITVYEKNVYFSVAKHAVESNTAMRVQLIIMEAQTLKWHQTHSEAKCSLSYRLHGMCQSRRDSSNSDNIHWLTIYIANDISFPLNFLLP